MKRLALALAFALGDARSTRSLRTAMARQAMTSSDLEGINKAFDELDKNFDDSLSEDEMTSSAHFRALDLDHDGLVSRSEFARGASAGRSGLRVAAERVTRMAESEATEELLMLHSDASVVRASPTAAPTTAVLVKSEFECFTGPGRACKACKDLEDRTDHDQCLECNEGYKLEKQKCAPYMCDLEGIDGCKHCRATHERTADRQCGECDKGYLLTESFKCRSFRCDAKTAGCTSCRPQKELTKDQQCVTCKAGFKHLADQTCRKFICDASEIENCQSCRDASRLTDDHQCHCGIKERCLWCETCKPGFKLTENLCEPFACSTGPLDACKSCEKLENRIKENECSECNPGFKLLNGTCQPYSCSPGLGSECLKCQLLEKRTAEQQCLPCNRGFKLNQDSKCEPYECHVGTEDECRICTRQEARTADGQCYQCNPGYRLTRDLHCEAFSCEQGVGAGCKTCRLQATRTDENQCNTCNDGYGLVNGTSKPFTCTPGPGAGCKACKSQLSMTGFNQCAACNDGYTLTSESTCQLGSENWASNTKVVRYAKQVVRDLVRHLDTNLDGNIDKNELNEKEIDEPIQRGIAGLRGGIIEGQVDSVPSIVFGAADADGDGLLSREEFKALEARERARQNLE